MKQAALSFAGRASNPTKASPAQLAARKRFAEMARSGAFKKATKRKANPTKNETIFKIGDMVTTDKGELGQVSYKQVQPGGYADVYRLLDVKANDPYKQTFLENGNFINGTRLKKATKRKANPTPSQVPQIILQQLGGSKFIAMTGAKEFIGGSEFLGFKIPKNMSTANRVTIKYFPAKDLYEINFIKSDRYGLNTKIVKSFDNVYADQLRDIFTSVTGMETSLGTLGRKTNPAKKTVSQKISQLVHEGYPQRQAVAVALSEQRAGKVKRNPSGLYAMKTQYLVSCPATKKNMGFFDKQSDAKIYAQELADKHGMQYAISTVKVPKIQAVHFVVGESTKSFKV